MKGGVGEKFAYLHAERSDRMILDHID